MYKKKNPCKHLGTPLQEYGIAHAKSLRLSKLGAVERPRRRERLEWSAKGRVEQDEIRGKQGPEHRKSSDLILSQAVIIQFKGEISNCDPWTSSISITWELVRNASPRAPPGHT